ncbi:TIGR04211 family SH3 domain-containing protein [Reinekea marina]|uniref:TIGR04211 family SH3 domain-containing protein n=1 Tax=Reinekea marina TaxID=1310421 RepID=A0ABV7WS89_9GAMM|nr:TIGR04211 family SH3 domain-containing protein [Reinekea marina]MDN3650428.1 TIGR04211 family SH3 domain-containing protein [Reinekea marina]
MLFRRAAKTFLLAIFLTSSISAYAETVWLSDNLWVNVRTGPSNEFRVLKTVQSGTRMEVLEKPEDGDFYRVRTENGLEGWIPSRYLIDEPTGRLLAESLAAEKAQLQQQLESIEKKYNDLAADKGDVKGELSSLRASNAELTKELNRIKAISENAINLDQQYQLLAEENAKLSNELDVAIAENIANKEFNDNTMLYTGAALVILGLVLGILLPRVTARRRRDGWS